MYLSDRRPLPVNYNPLLSWKDLPNEGVRFNFFDIIFFEKFDCFMIKVNPIKRAEYSADSCCTNLLGCC